MGTVTTAKRPSVLSVLKRHYRDISAGNMTLESAKESVDVACGCNVSESFIRKYVSKRVYRENYASDRRTSKHRKSCEEKEALLQMSEECGCKCPPRDDWRVKKFTDQFAHLSYSDIQQWFGQRRFKKNNTRKRRLLSADFSPVDRVIPSTEDAGWINKPPDYRQRGDTGAMWHLHMLLSEAMSVQASRFHWSVQY